MKLIGTFLATLLLCSFSPAQSSSAKYVQVSSKVIGGPIRPGSTFKAEVRLKIAKGWHINSHAPAQEYMIGTNFVVDSTEGCTVAAMEYPKGQSVTLSISETPFSVYDGTVAIVVTLKTSADLPKGKHVLKGKLTLQACNDQICVAPSTIPVDIPVTVGG